jgi:hypothetical protein
MTLLVSISLQHSLVKKLLLGHRVSAAQISPNLTKIIVYYLEEIYVDFELTAPPCGLNFLLAILYHYLFFLITKSINNSR